MMFAWEGENSLFLPIWCDVGFEGKEEETMAGRNDLQREVLDELEWEPGVNAADIGVAVKDGVVTLSGYVANLPEKWAVEDAVKRVAGVKGWANEIQVRLPAFIERTDTEIAQAAVNALEWNVALPRDRVKVKVEDGWLTLEGEIEHQYQKNLAAQTVYNLTGVKGISNLISVMPRLTPSEIQSRIEKAFERHAVLDAASITIETHGGRVTLKGKLSSWVEREEAERVVWAAPGISSVNNLITIL